MSGVLGNVSLSARRAWIEIGNTAATLDYIPVALRKESVDRNIMGPSAYSTSSVALRKESVDRNRNPCCYQYRRRGSLSARRAWIEIPIPGH